MKSTDCEALLYGIFEIKDRNMEGINEDKRKEKKTLLPLATSLPCRPLTASEHGASKEERSEIKHRCKS